MEKKTEKTQAIGYLEYRNRLARERTKLARTRTCLAWIRTLIAIIIFILLVIRFYFMKWNKFLKTPDNKLKIENEKI